MHLFLPPLILYGHQYLVFRQGGSTSMDFSNPNQPSPLPRHTHNIVISYSPLLYISQWALNIKVCAFRALIQTISKPQQRMPSRRSYILPTKFKYVEHRLSRCLRPILTSWLDTNNFPSLEGTLAGVCIAGT